MARYPHAIWKPVTVKSRARLTTVDRFNLHIAVSETSSLHSFFNRKGNPDSHFYVRRDGTVEQYVDTQYRAYCDVEGNGSSISVETQGGVKNPNQEEWTEEQVKALAALWAWVRKTHGVKNKLATNSLPNRDSSRGLSWHRLGIDPWRVSGGLRYSNSRGKVCPGTARIKQAEEIHALSQADAKPKPKPEPKPKPKPEPKPKPKPKPEPKPTAKVKQIAVDGMWGSATTRRLQEVYKTTVDAVISGQRAHSGNKNIYSAQFVSAGSKSATGSNLVRAIQRSLGVSATGQLDTVTIKAMQKALKTPVDGVISSKSMLVSAMQKSLNAGKRPF